jgi:hypothetical protein
MIVLRFELSVFLMHVFSQAHGRTRSARQWTPILNEDEHHCQITKDYKPFEILLKDSLYILIILLLSFLK